MSVDGVRALGKTITPRARLLALLLSVPVLGACTTGRYLLRATQGHVDVMLRALPIHDLLRDPRTPPGLRDVLGEMEPLRAYARDVGLSIAGNYETFVPLGRPEVLWNVNASTPLSFQQHTWRFPLIGTIPYLGFYDAFEATRFAEELAAREGLDVYVRPVSAYSTLGWFDDPLLSSMIEPGPGGIGMTVNRVLHETTHATIYVPGQSTYNENIAAFIGDGLAAAYLTDRFGPQSPQVAAYFESQRKSARELDVLLGALGELEQVYVSDSSDDEKLARKREVFSRLEHAVDAPRPLNNATLVYLRTYRSGAEELQQLHETCGADWVRTIRALSGARPADFDTDQQEELAPVIERIGERGC